MLGEGQDLALVSAFQASAIQESAIQESAFSGGKKRANGKQQGGDICGCGLGCGRPAVMAQRD